MVATGCCELRMKRWRNLSKQSRQAITTVAKLAATVGVFYLLLSHQIENAQGVKVPIWRIILDEIENVDVTMLVLLLVVAATLKAVGIFASMLRWHLLLVGQEERSPVQIGELSAAAVLVAGDHRSGVICLARANEPVEQPFLPMAADRPGFHLGDFRRSHPLHSVVDLRGGAGGVLEESEVDHGVVRGGLRTRAQGQRREARKDEGRAASGAGGGFSGHACS